MGSPVAVLHQTGSAGQREHGANSLPVHMGGVAMWRGGHAARLVSVAEKDAALGLPRGAGLRGQPGQQLRGRRTTDRHRAQPVQTHVRPVRVSNLRELLPACS